MMLVPKMMEWMCVAAVCISAFFSPASAQVRTLRWSTEFCKFSGTYNSKKYTAEQLRNTIKLLPPGEFGLSFMATVWRFEDIGALDLAQLDREYKDVSSSLRALNIVKSAYWESVRQKKLAEIEQVYRLSRITMQAYTKPAILREYAGAEECKAKFAEPLILGGDKLLLAWKMVNEESRTRNSDPDRIRRIFDDQMASPDKLKFARVEVMSFGWWNCANNFIEYDQPEGVEREREFNKLFIRVRTIQCEGP